ncbi:MAG: hypothetical protein AB7I34_26615, partial [Rhizobiaceae bacterium]
EDTLAAAQSAPKTDAKFATTFYEKKGVTRVEVRSDGSMVQTELNKGRAYADIGLPPGQIMIPGFGVTDIQSAKYAGILPHSYREGDPLPFDAPAGENASTPTGKQGGTESGNDGAVKDATDHAAAVLDNLVARLGGNVVEDTIWEYADSMIDPLDGPLPHGVSAQQVTQLEDGFTLQADRVLSGVRASVALVEEVLTNEEIRQVRTATISGDKGKLEHFGRIAATRFEDMPNKDPKAFAELVELMSATERKALTQNATGEWIVTVPGRDPMPYWQAVRAGLVRIGKV